MSAHGEESFRSEKQEDSGRYDGYFDTRWITMATKRVASYASIQMIDMVCWMQLQCLSCVLVCSILSIPWVLACSASRQPINRVKLQ